MSRAESASSAVTRALWREAELPEAALERLDLVGDAPLLPTSFHVGVAAHSSIAGSASAPTSC